MRRGHIGAGFAQEEAAEEKIIRAATGGATDAQGRTCFAQYKQTGVGERKSDPWRRAHLCTVEPCSACCANQVAFLLMIMLIVAGLFLSPVFLTPRNLLNILWAVSVLGVVALGQTLLIITGNFDISVSTVVPFVGIVVFGLQNAGWGLSPSMLGGLVGVRLSGF